MGGLAGKRVTLLSEETLERMAHIIGGFSAAQLAINDIARRREAGEDPVAVQCDQSILVVPRDSLIPAEPLPSPSTRTE